MANVIAFYKIKRLFFYYNQKEVNKTEVAISLKIARSTVFEYFAKFDKISRRYPNICQDDNIFQEMFLERNSSKRKKSSRYIDLIIRFPSITKKLETGEYNLITLWKEYINDYPAGYGYTQFVAHFHTWRELSNQAKFIPNKWEIKSIPPEDMKILKKWRSSNDRRKWARAVVIMELHRGCYNRHLASKLEISDRKIKKWAISYREGGLEALFHKKERKLNRQISQNIKAKKERIIKLLHETPKLHNINRSSWSLKSLAQSYEKQNGEYISISAISDYLKSEGYSIKKAKTVLTSPDPDYRKKLKKITNILSSLGDKEKFFSIDEYGPFSVKIQGGRTWTQNNDTKSIPRRQKSKGKLICTAALELSTNQVTHFYSKTKNTKEMIKLMNILLDKYPDEDRLYLSWDAASWHISKDLYDKIEEVNSSDYRSEKKSAIVKLAPLPVSAQFLNVIESVFSGMAKAIIHNSDYESVDECKLAIDQYFHERNEYFKKHPKRAGKKIWGKEIVKPVFSEVNNCKDPKWR